jgi:hypothetical protein
VITRGQAAAQQKSAGVDYVDAAACGPALKTLTECDLLAGVIRASWRWRIKSDQASGRVAGRASHREGTFIMPVAFVFESDKVDQSSYDALLKAIGRESVDAPVPPGHIAHLAGPRPGGGWRAIDLWESEEAASAFYGSDQFAPVTAAAAELGITSTPWPMRRVEIDQAIRHLS